MPRIVHATRVERPPAHVFAVLTDFSRVSKVLPGVVESRVLTPGPIGVGSRIVEKREVKGKLRESEFLVVAHDPPRLFWMEVHAHGKKQGEGGFELAPDGGGTRLAYTLDFSLPGLTKLLTPFVKGFVGREMAGDLDAIRRESERA